MFQPVSPFNVRSVIPMKAMMTPMIVEKEGIFLKRSADKMGTMIAANPVINADFDIVVYFSPNVWAA